MIHTRLYLDLRRAKKDGTYPLVYAIRKDRQQSFMPMGIFLAENHWDSQAQMVVNRADARVINHDIQDKIYLIEAEIFAIERLPNVGTIGVKEIRNRIDNALGNTSGMRRRGELFLDYFRKVAGQKSPSTRKLMLSTITRIEALMPNAKSLTFASINRSWLTDFLNALKKTSSSPNYWSIQLRNIRTVWNDARANNIVNNYPFQDFKIPSAPTAKRNLSLEQVRTLMASKGIGERGEMAIDYFMLSLYLIGINDVDLCHLTPDNIVNGRLEYNRAKTGKHYSIKIEPEAMALIEKYRGKKYLLNALDIYIRHQAFAKYMNKQLKNIGVIEEETYQSKRGVRTRIVAKSDLPKGLSHYWCRHTWASLAHEVGISQDTIALGLGHSFGNQVTAIYINPSLSKVDEANRKVIDYVFGK